MTAPNQSIADVTASVSSSAALLATYNTDSIGTLALHLYNSGATALNSFSLRGKVRSTHANAAAPLKSSGFTTQDYLVFFCSADPTTLAASGHSVMAINTELFQSIEVWGSVASGSTTLAIAASGYES